MGGGVERGSRYRCVWGGGLKGAAGIGGCVWGGGGGVERGSRYRWGGGVERGSRYRCVCGGGG